MSWEDAGKIIPRRHRQHYRRSAKQGERIDVARKYGIVHSTIFYYCGSGEKETKKSNSFDQKEYNKKWQEKNKEKQKNIKKL